MDFNDAGGGAFTQALCGDGYSLSSPLPSAACGESCAATTGVQADIDACAAISLTGADYSGGVGTDRRVQCEGTADPCQYTAPSTCTAAICCDGAAPFLLHALALSLASSGSKVVLSSDSSRPRVVAALQTLTRATLSHVSARAPPAPTNQRRVRGTRAPVRLASSVLRVRTGPGALRAMRLRGHQQSRAPTPRTAWRPAPLTATSSLLPARP